MKTAPQHEISTSIDSLTRRNRFLQLLNEAGQALTATLDLEQVLERLLQIAIKIVGADGSSVWLWHEQNQDLLICKAAFHFSDGDHDLIVNQTLKPGQGVAGWTAQTGESNIVNNTSDDAHFYDKIDQLSGFQTHSLMAVPMIFRGEIIGVLEIVNKYSGEFDEEDLAVAESLASSASIAIENARLVETLRRQKQDLQKHNEELDAFAHTVAHNLKSPLARLAGFAELLIVDDNQFSQTEKNNLKQRIINNAQSMNKIVDELLLLSSVRKADVSAVSLNMRDIVHSALARVQDLIADQEAVIDVSTSWPDALGYAPWIEEVWENYLTNALKYGGRPPIIKLGSQDLNDGFIKFWVQDEGPGIPKEQQEFLFTPFTRLSNLQISGYGLGLSIVYRIICKLGGQVGVESQEDAGSLFYFTLPAATL